MIKKSSENLDKKKTKNKTKTDKVYVKTEFYSSKHYICR